MTKKLIQLNRISSLCFFLSSFSLCSIPFFDFSKKFPLAMTVFAAVFWTGLVVGIVLQRVIYSLVKKHQTERQRRHGAKWFLVSFAVFFLLFLFLLVFGKEDVTLMSFDMALMFFSIEMYFIMKWRFST